MQTTFKEQIDAIRQAREFISEENSLMSGNIDQALNDAASSLFALSLQQAHETSVASENAELSNGSVHLPILHVEGYELRNNLMRNHVNLYSKLIILSRKHRVKISRIVTEGKTHDFYRLRLEVGNRVFFEDEGRFEPYKAYDRLLESISKL